MVIPTEPPRSPPPDPVADAAAVEAVTAAATSNARQGASFSSFPSLKTWGSHRVLRCAHVNRAGDAIATANGTAMLSPEKLDGAGEKARCHLTEVEGGSSGDAADADHVEEEEAQAPATSPPWKLRTRRRPKPKAAAPAASSSPPPERRPSRARAEALDRARFSVTLTSEEIEEDIYAVTGARPRRRPKRHPRPVQKQLDMLFPGSWLSEITAETYRVPDDR
ncbi:hypothetical protein BAE44_0018246 [Dichanthelium oligosanthes]|uniref:DUF1639 domain-containing protein n=1 Tax=Dichanthelium oligosanthes TaxID=888268 RepID=A0A1E5V6G6_9POAL|nr:hypothetical protein BAE44_0018246 [Dichanthelium oligosanthes]